jgi:hypothetical protein
VRPLIAAIIEIALHRRGPDQLPPSDFLLALLFVAYLIVGMGALSAQSSPFPLAAVVFVGNSVVYLLYCWIVLKTVRRQSRFRQTASALLGADAFFNFLAIPVSLMAASSEVAGFAVLLLYMLFFWSVDVAGFIISRAIERPYIVGVLIVVAYIIAARIVQDSLIPVAS